VDWAEYFPNDCPPTDAKTGSFVVYRFLEGDRITASDFLTVREKAIDRKFPDLEKECRACSLSVFIDFDEVSNLQRRVPRWRKAIAIGRLNETSGKLKHTPSPQTNNSHHSWWIRKEVTALDLFFEVIEPPLNR
jgi:hypothetical protein